MRGPRSSPSTNSRLISNPTTKKKTAISPSLTNSRRSRLRLNGPTSIENCVCQNDWYASLQGELATTRATAVAASSTTPPAASVWRKSTSGRIVTVAAAPSAALPPLRSLAMCRSSRSTIQAGGSG